MFVLQCVKLGRYLSIYNLIIYYRLVSLHFDTYRFDLEMTYCNLNMLL
jgi:hypothetical protein